MIPLLTSLAEAANMVRTAGWFTELALVNRNTVVNALATSGTALRNSQGTILVERTIIKTLESFSSYANADITKRTALVITASDLAQKLVDANLASGSAVAPIAKAYRRKLSQWNAHFDSLCISYYPFSSRAVSAARERVDMMNQQNMLKDLNNFIGDNLLSDPKIKKLADTSKADIISFVVSMAAAGETLLASSRQVPSVVGLAAIADAVVQSRSLSLPPMKLDLPLRQSIYNTIK